jgi:hypothetical protein
MRRRTRFHPFSRFNHMIPAHLSERLSSHARKTLRRSESIARDEGSPSVGPKHLLLALLLENGALGSFFLTNAGVKQEVLGRFFPSTGNNSESTTKRNSRPERRRRLPLSPHMKTVLSRAYFAASQFRSPYVGTEHLAYSLFENPDPDVTEYPRSRSESRKSPCSRISKHISDWIISRTSERCSTSRTSPSPRRNRAASWTPLSCAVYDGPRRRSDHARRPVLRSRKGNGSDRPHPWSENTRTIRSSSANQASGKPRSSRRSRSGSHPEMLLISSRGSAFSRSTSLSSSPARASAANSSPVSRKSSVK